MDIDQIQTQLKNAPSFRLLRGDNAPLIVSFLYAQFKQTHRLVIGQGDLLEKLEDLLELLRSYQPQLYPKSAKNYLDDWSDSGFLHKYFDNRDEPVFELTPDTEKVIGWLQELQQSQAQFIGTESRFLRIFSLLQEIEARSTEDVAERLAQLERQKAEIQQEIDRIQATGLVERFNETQIRERFFEANETARRLLADFREVEQNFRDITRKVQETQLMAGMRKGAIVGAVLDADEALKESPQGQSFYAFWEFLMSHVKQEELRALLEKVYRLPDLQAVVHDQPILRRIKASLIEAGEKVVLSNQRLAEQLRKMLDEQHLAENRRAQALIEEIKKLAIIMKANPPHGREFMTLEGEAELQLPLERPLWEPTEVVDFSDFALRVAQVDLSAGQAAALFNQFYVDEWLLQQHIDHLLQQQPQVTLTELTRHYPIQQGVSEVVAYVALAAKHEPHEIDSSVSEEILLQGDDDWVMRLTMPRVIFRR